MAVQFLLPLQVVWHVTGKGVSKKSGIDCGELFIQSLDG